MQKPEIQRLLNKYARKTPLDFDNKPESKPTVPDLVPATVTVESIQVQYTTKSIGKYTNWSNEHNGIASEPWCQIGVLMELCNAYGQKPFRELTTETYNSLTSKISDILRLRSPFDVNERFPNDVVEPEKLWICIGRCPNIKYHLNCIMCFFQKPFAKLTEEKKREIRQKFLFALNELHLDISARISEIQLYDRPVFEREFHLIWQDIETIV